MTVQSECIEDRWRHTIRDISKLGQHPGVHFVPESLRTFPFAIYHKPSQHTSFWYVYSSLPHISTIRETCGDVDRWHHRWFHLCKSEVASVQATKSCAGSRCMQTMTAEFAVDLGSCFALGKGDHPLFVTSNRRTSVKNTVRWSAVVFCACEIIQLFTVMLCVVKNCA